MFKMISLRSAVHCSVLKYACLLIPGHVRIDGDIDSPNTGMNYSKLFKWYKLESICPLNAFSCCIHIH